MAAGDLDAAVEMLEATARVLMVTDGVYEIGYTLW